MSLRILIDDTEVTALMDRLQHLDLSSLAASAAEQVAIMGQDAFSDPDLRPAPWAPLSESYEKQLKGRWNSKVSKIKGKKAREAAVFEKQILIETGDLRKSITASKTARKTADGYEARISSDREYAAYHQFGTKKMDERPFLPIKADLTLGTATLTDTAWTTIKPTLLESLKRIISADS